MITLADFKKYEDLEQQLKEFLISRLNEYNEAKAYRTEDYYIDGIDIKYIDSWEILNSWKIHDSKIIVYFSDTDRGFSHYTHELPLEHLFDPDFKHIMKAQFDEERRKEELRILEYQKQHDEELKLKAEKKRVKEIELMRELIKKYPDEL